MKNTVAEKTENSFLNGVFESLTQKLSPLELKQLSLLLLDRAVSLGESPPLAQVQSADGVTVVSWKDPGFDLRVIDSSTASKPEVIVHEYFLHDVADGDQVDQETRWEGTEVEYARLIEERSV